jgi:hypothetical protein
MWPWLFVYKIMTLFILYELSVLDYTAVSYPHFDIDQHVQLYIFHTLLFSMKIIAAFRTVQNDN